VDLRAVKAASRAELSACAVAAARNAQDLLHDARALAGSGSRARAYALAVLAVEESGKAAGLTALAGLPNAMRTNAAAGRLLQWHQLKQVGGLLIAAVTFETPGVAAKLAAMPAAQVTQILRSLGVSADEADHLKRRGLYVDMGPSGRIREPSEITEAEVTSQLARARQAAASAAMLLDAEVQARIAKPPAEATDLCEALASALSLARYTRTPEAAAKVLLDAVRRFQTTTAKNGRPAPAAFQPTGRPELQGFAPIGCASSESCRSTRQWPLPLRAMNLPIRRLLSAGVAEGP
jgi:AbiV family abortive infection protein